MIIGEIRTAKEIGYKGHNTFVCQACGVCGKERWVRLNRKSSGLCASCNGKTYIKELHAWGSKASRWKGGRHKEPNGYIVVRLQPDDFFSSMVDKSGYVPEHRLLVARVLNRCLLPWEVVHHINGIKDDNRPENLKLLNDQQCHLVDVLMKKRFKQLESRVTLLEAENVILKEEAE